MNNGPYSGADPSAIQPPPIRMVTRFLAEMQTSIVAAGIRAFNGDLDRFIIYTLIVRQGAIDWHRARPVDDPDAGSISVNALAASLSRSFETVRRHVLALIAAGLCHRTSRGVVAGPDAQGRPEVQDLIMVAHDSLVRLVEDFARLGLPLPPGRQGMGYDPVIGLQAAADIMLAVVDQNMPAHREWLNLVLFSTILCANSRAYIDDPVLAWRYADHTTLAPDSIRRPLRPSMAARAIGIAETTVRRHAGELIRRGSVRRVPGGLLVDEAWMNQPYPVAISTASFHNVRRILMAIEARGFPFADPISAYMRGRPEPVHFA